MHDAFASLSGLGRLIVVMIVVVAVVRALVAAALFVVAVLVSALFTVWVFCRFGFAGLRSIWQQRHTGEQIRRELARLEMERLLRRAAVVSIALITAMAHAPDEAVFPAAIVTEDVRALVRVARFAPDLAV